MRLVTRSDDDASRDPAGAGAAARASSPVGAAAVAVSDSQSCPRDGRSRAGRRSPPCRGSSGPTCATGPRSGRRGRKASAQGDRGRLLRRVLVGQVAQLARRVVHRVARHLRRVVERLALLLLAVEVGERRQRRAEDQQASDITSSSSISVKPRCEEASWGQPCRGVGRAGLVEARADGRHPVRGACRRAGLGIVAMTCRWPPSRRSGWRRCSSCRGRCGRSARVPGLRWTQFSFGLPRRRPRA